MNTRDMYVIWDQGQIKNILFSDFHYHSYEIDQFLDEEGISNFSRDMVALENMVKILLQKMDLESAWCMSLDQYNHTLDMIKSRQDFIPMFKKYATQIVAYDSSQEEKPSGILGKLFKS